MILNELANEDLRKWFKQKWVNIGKKKDGKHPPCGTSGSKSGYAKCVPAAKAAGMSKKEKESATRRKRAAQNDADRGGKDSRGQGKSPINVSTKKNESTNPLDIIRDLDKVKSNLLKKVDVLIAKKKKLYSNVDIESPMSTDEKKLNKDIADIFGEIQQLILQKRKVKNESVNEEKVYIDYLNKAKGFKQDRIKFTSYEAAVKWARKNFEKFNPDMIKYESISESDLKGYIVADVVDDIVKSISSKFVKGYVEDAPNRNYIYLKLTDIKFGSGVIKMLKSQFGINAKVDKTFGHMPTVSFPSNKVISEDWSQKYKKSIDCNNPKGFSQKAHCAGKSKNENMASKLTLEEKMNLFLEKNVPNDPAKWAASKAAAKRKFDVYPSAYANGWAAKNYKGKGGTWKTAK